MEPLIREGDWVEVVPGETPIGSVVLATSSSGEIVCHRVIANSQAGCELVGDRSLVSEPASHQQILGRVRGIERDNLSVAYNAKTTAMERLLTEWHRRSIDRRGTFSGRVLELGRRLLLSLHARGVWAQPGTAPTPG